jgi:hypothetical protein
MARPARTYLLLVSPNEPRGRRFVRLNAPSVLQWFQQAWTRLNDLHVFREELNGDVYGLDSLFAKIAELKVSAPTSAQDMKGLLEKYVYYERNIEVSAHLVHVETDDDEVDTEYFIFDETFLEGDDARELLPRAGRHKDRYAKSLDALRGETD